MLTLLVEGALGSMLLGSTAWLGLKLLRIKDPRAEMTVWKIVLIAAVVMPFLVPWTRATMPVTHPDTPSLHVSHTRGVGTSLSEFDGPWPDTLSGGAQRGPGASDRSGSPSFVPGPSAAARAPEPAWRLPIEKIDWLGVATGVYLLVSGVLLLKLLIGLALLFRLARSARPLTVLPSGAHVRTSESVAVPVTFASVIVLPGDWEMWGGVKQQAVLAHELSHVARGDFYALLLASLYRVAFWFNPLSWWLSHRLGELMEMLSDDAAVVDLGDAPAYAEVLLDVAANARSTPLAIAMARTTMVRRRIERILSRTAPPPLGRRKRMLISAGLVPLVALSAVTVARGTPPAESKASVVAQAAPPAASPPRVVDARILVSYVGYYERESSAAAEPLIFTITREGDRLLLERTGIFAGNKIALFAKNDHTFAYLSVVGGPNPS
jgi:bla regulator protein blaR1